MKPAGADGSVAQFCTRVCSVNLWLHLLSQSTAVLLDINKSWSCRSGKTCAQQLGLVFPPEVQAG